jgi:PEP-CTERM motif
MKYPGALVAVLFAVVGSAHATEFLQNGSFETGDFTGWSLANPAGPLTSVQPTAFGYGAENGQFYVYAGPPSSLPGVLSQTFSDTAGEQLNVSGWAIGDTFDLPNNLGEVSYFFDNVLLGSPDLSSGKWTPSTFQVTATGSDRFSIQFANDSSYNGLDNFSVASSGSAVPEPSTWILLLIGLIGLGPFAATARRAVLPRASEV